MKHSAKRIHKGKYTYRGYEVEDMTPYSDTGYTFWNISLPGESACETCNTLGDCKRTIDTWLDA